MQRKPKRKSILLQLLEEGLIIKDLLLHGDPNVRKGWKGVRHSID